MTRTWLCRLALIAFVSGGCVIGDDGDSTLTISNRSSYTLFEVRIAEVNDPNWGPNLLPDVLFPGEDLHIANIACGTYDALVVDDTGVECQLNGLYLCFDNALWVVDNSTLDICAFN